MCLRTTWLAIALMLLVACVPDATTATNCESDDECPRGYRCEGSPAMCKALADAADAGPVGDAGAVDLGAADVLTADAARADTQAPDLAADDSATPVDGTPPPPLDLFDALTGDAPGQIKLLLDFPADVSDYHEVRVLRVAGATAPPATCDQGALAASFQVGAFIDQELVDGGLILEGSYSYRACITDAVGNLTAVQIAEDVQAKGCVFGELFTAQPQDLKASHMDLHVFLVRGSEPGWSPVRIFEGVTFNPGDTIALASYFGNSICRVYPDHTAGIGCGPIACPGSWKLYFRRGDDSVIPGASAEDLIDFITPQEVPAEAQSAWIGFRDGDTNCQTGGTCGEVARGYFDNEGIRTSTSDLSTNGCDFTFTYQQMICE